MTKLVIFLLWDHSIHVCTVHFSDPDCAVMTWKESKQDCLMTLLKKKHGKYDGDILEVVGVHAQTWLANHLRGFRRAESHTWLYASCTSCQDNMYVSLLLYAYLCYRVGVRDADLEAVMLIESTVSNHYLAISEQLVSVSGGLDSATAG